MPSYIAFHTANSDVDTEQLRIDNFGNVGIGTTTPQTKLDVDGTVQMAGFSLPTAPTAGHVLTSDASGSGTWQASAAGDGDSDWTISGSDMFSAVSGNVGIGTTEPEARLEVRGGETILQQEDWKDLSFLTADWIISDTNEGDYGPLQYYRDSTGIVHLRGAIKSVHREDFGYTIAELPVGYRPEYLVSFLILPVFEFSLNCLIYKELCHVTTKMFGRGMSIYPLLAPSKAQRHPS